VEEAVDPDSLDRSDIESRLEEAKRGVEEAEEGSEERARCERNVQRYKAFLEVTNS
jgi:F0F1-type ATP synthase epsilon subunit